MERIGEAADGLRTVRSDTREAPLCGVTGPDQEMSIVAGDDRPIAFGLESFVHDVVREPAIRVQYEDARASKDDVVSMERAGARAARPEPAPCPAGEVGAARRAEVLRTRRDTPHPTGGFRAWRSEGPGPRSRVCRGARVRDARAGHAQSVRSRTERARGEETMHGRARETHGWPMTLGACLQENRGAPAGCPSRCRCTSSCRRTMFVRTRNTTSPWNGEHRRVQGIAIPLTVVGAFSLAALGRSLSPPRVRSVWPPWMRSIRSPSHNLQPARREASSPPRSAEESAARTCRGRRVRFLPSGESGCQDYLTFTNWRRFLPTTP